jgi:hypothetical protein
MHLPAHHAGEGGRGGATGCGGGLGAISNCHWCCAVLCCAVLCCAVLCCAAGPIPGSHPLPSPLVLLPLPQHKPFHTPSPVPPPACPQGEAPTEYILILCNAIGSPIDSKYIEVEPRYVALTGEHCLVCVGGGRGLGSRVPGWGCFCPCPCSCRCSYIGACAALPPLPMPYAASTTDLSLLPLMLLLFALTPPSSPQTPRDVCHCGIGGGGVCVAAAGRGLPPGGAQQQRGGRHRGHQRRRAGVFPEEGWAGAADVHRCAGCMAGEGRGGVYGGAMPTSSSEV